MTMVRTLAAVAMVTALAAPADGRQRNRNALPPLPSIDDVGSAAVLAALRSGGYILACRHAITDCSGNQRGRFNRRPREGNSVLMTHQGILRSALSYSAPGEGDCILPRPASDRPEVIANVTVPEWERMASRRRERS